MAETDSSVQCGVAIFALCGNISSRLQQMLCCSNVIPTHHYDEWSVAKNAALVHIRQIDAKVHHSLLHPGKHIADVVIHLTDPIA